MQELKIKKKQGKRKHLKAGGESASLHPSASSLLSLSKPPIKKHTLLHLAAYRRSV